MRMGTATGIQIAFLSFAVIFLTAPLTLYIGRKLELPSDWTKLTGRIAQLAMLAAAIYIVDRIRPQLLRSLLHAVPRDRRREVVVVTTAEAFFPFAFFGGVMLLNWIVGGPAAVERRFPTDVIHTIDQAYAFSGIGLVLLFCGVAIAPLVEEIIFRGLLYTAWERAWGWLPSMILTSTVFGLYHHNFSSAFLFSVLLVCLYRRTGTLLAPMLVHAVHNLFIWYPLAGQFYMPDPHLPAGDLSSWWFHLIALTVYVVALPTYIVMSRHSPVGYGHEPLPR